MTSRKDDLERLDPSDQSGRGVMVAAAIAVLMSVLVLLVIVFLLTS